MYLVSLANKPAVSHEVPGVRKEEPIRPPAPATGILSQTTKGKIKLL